MSSMSRPKQCVVSMSDEQREWVLSKSNRLRIALHGKLVDREIKSPVVKDWSLISIGPTKCHFDVAFTVSGTEVRDVVTLSRTDLKQVYE